MFGGWLQNRWRTRHAVNHDITALLHPKLCHSVARDLLAPGLDGSSCRRGRGNGGGGGRELLLNLRDHGAGFASL